MTRKSHAPVAAIRNARSPSTPARVVVRENVDVEPSRARVPAIDDLAELAVAIAARMLACEQRRIGLDAKAG